MTELILKNVSMNINGLQIVTKKSVRISGLCLVSISSNSGNLRDFLLLFCVTHIYSFNDIKIEGTAILDGMTLPASKLHFLLNRNMIFDENDTVINVLTTLNRGQATSVISKLQINFHRKKLKKLNCTESRIFEIAVNLVSNPHIIYIKKLIMDENRKSLVLDVLKEHVILHGCLALVETEYLPVFDSSLIIGVDRILSFDAKGTDKFFRDLRMREYLLPPTNKPLSTDHTEMKLDDSFGKDFPPFDYQEIFRKNKTESLIDEKHRQIPIRNKIFNLGNYKVSVRQAIQMAFRKYEISCQRFDQKLSIGKSIFPVISVILSVRLFNILNNRKLADLFPDLIATLLLTLFKQCPVLYLLTYFFNVFIIQEFSIKRLVFLFNFLLRSELSSTGNVLVFAAIFFSIIYHYSFIFEEELQFLNYHMNVIFTPGTFILSIFIYIMMAHFTSFMIVGLIFNVKIIIISVMTAFFINLLYCSFTGKRLRSSLLGVFVAIFFHIIYADCMKKKLSMLKYLYIAIVPCLTSNDPEGRSVDSLILSDKANLYMYFYYFMSYVICCYSLSYL